MDDFIAISALQHYAFCPRQFALIHIEQAWEDNYFTADGQVLHQRVDSGVSEQRRGIRSERGVLLRSDRYRLKGKMDLLEITSGNPPSYFPVEYKRGKPKVEEWDRIQLCAQALCIEEMRDVEVTQGAIWYWEVRKREPVEIDQHLRETTISVIEAAHLVLASGKTPPPIDNPKRCKACSLVSICEPKHFRQDRSARYLESLFEVEGS